MTFLTRFCAAPCLTLQSGSLQEQNMSRNSSRKSISGRALYAAEQQVDTWCRENHYKAPREASLIRRFIVGKACAVWLGEWEHNVRARCAKLAREALANEALYQIVLYNIPNRDRGGFSAGGLASRKEYLRWIRNVAHGLGGSEGIVIFEPDALAHAKEMQEVVREQRLKVMKDAIEMLTELCPNIRVYIDAGHPSWLSANVAAEYLLRAGAQFATGFSLNVSNAGSTDECYEYGMKIVNLIDPNLKFVVDTSRNGAGYPPEAGIAQWANNPNLRLGETPTTRVLRDNSYEDSLDALLWIKVPGESDGFYNGGPRAGQFWPEGALRLIGGDV